MMNRKRDDQEVENARPESTEAESRHSVFGIVLLIVAIVLGLLAARARVYHY
jgi:hypothetical protein